MGFKCLEHNEMVGSRNCMSKDIDLTSSLLSIVYFAPLDAWAKVLKTLDFWCLDTWNNIDQLLRSGSCIRMLVLVFECEGFSLESFPNDTSLHTRILVSFQKDLRLNLSHSNSTLRYSNTRSTPLKLIYVISSIYKPKIKCFNTFCPFIKRR